MTYDEWRRKVYTPMLLCSAGLVKGTNIILDRKLINNNVADCVNKYGYDICASVVAHTIRKRKYAEEIPPKLIEWADGISPITQFEYNSKRTFWELTLKCNDRLLVYIAKALLFYKKEVLGYVT